MKRVLSILMVVTLGIFIVVGNVHATAVLSLTDGANTVSISDGNADGVVSYNGAVGANFTVNVTTGITKPTIGAFDFPRIDLNSVNVSSSGGGSLTISFSDNGFYLPDTLSGFVTNIGGTTDGSVSAQSYLSSTNNVFATDTNIGNLGPFGPGAFSGSSTFGVNPADPFSLTLVATLTHSAAGQISSFDFETKSVPDASIMWLLGTAFIALGFLGRKKSYKL